MINEGLYVLDVVIILLLFFLLTSTRREMKRSLSKSENEEVVVDTSSLIDGRILEVANVGFVLGKILIPEFVINELQKVADSPDSLRRQRGRQGLKTLHSIQKLDGVKSEIVEYDFPEEKYVDQKIIKLAKLKDAKILTVDYNLNNVAKVHDIIVLNINELAKGLRPLFLPGEKIEVRIVQKGKEEKQGVGYLEDGTMIVVEFGEKYIGKTVECLVSRILQTDAGRMVFARPKSYGLDRVGASKNLIRFPRFLPWQKNRHQNNNNNRNNNYHRP